MKDSLLQVPGRGGTSHHGGYLRGYSSRSGGRGSKGKCGQELFLWLPWGEAGKERWAFCGFASLNNFHGLWGTGVVPSCLVISGVISAGIRPESENPVEKEVRAMGSGMIGLHFERWGFWQAEGELFIISRNWFTLEGGVPPGSAKTQMQSIKIQTIQKVKTSNYRMKSPGDPVYSMATIVNNTLWYPWKLLGE